MKILVPNKSAKRATSTSGTYASEFSIGQKVLFQPDLTLADSFTKTCREATMAEIASVNFKGDKVTYDLYICDPFTGNVFSFAPIKDVDYSYVFPIMFSRMGTLIPNQGVAIDQPDLAGEDAAAKPAESPKPVDATTYCQGDLAAYAPAETSITDVFQVLNALCAQAFASTSKKKKPQTDRQHMYSSLMRKLAGEKGELLAKMLVGGNEDEFVDGFQGLAKDIIKDFNRRNKK